MYRILLLSVLFFLSNSVLTNGQSVIATRIAALQQSGATFTEVNQLFEVAPAPKNPTALEREVQYLDLNSETLSEIMTHRPDYLSVKIPYHNTIVTVDLYQQQILTPDFHIRTGDWQKQMYAPGVYYRGVIRGENGSLAAISFFEHEIIGVVATPLWGNMNLGRVEKTGNTNRYVFYKESLLPTQPFADCITRDPVHPTKPMPLNQVEVSGCIRIFFEADYVLYQNKGNSVQGTVDYVTGFFNVVSTLYANETVSIAMSQIYVWTTADPYNYASSGDALGDFLAYRTDFDGDLAHLTSLAGSGLGGIAYLNSLCTGSNYAFSGINSTYNALPAYSWTVMVVSHEMGHSFSSRHTHWCGWTGGAIDNCGPTAGYGYETPPSCSSAPTPVGGGTVMSYCHLVGGVGINLANGFGPLPGNAIRNGTTAALATSGCGVNAACPTISCSAPTAITFSAVTNNSATVGWNTIAGATAYNVQYRISPTGAWTTVNSATTSATLTGLNALTIYEVQVRSVCGANASPYLTGAIIKTLVSPCMEPSALSGTANSFNSAILNWTENGSATAWEIQWGATGFSLGTGTTVSTSTKPYTLTNLNSANAYSYYLRSNCTGGLGNSGWVGPFNFVLNDLSAYAIPLTVGAGCTGNIYKNTGATTSSGEFSPSTGNGGYWATGTSNTVWYKFISPASGSIYVTTDFSPQGTNDDTQVALYNAPNPTSINQLLVSNEDGGIYGTLYNSYVYYSGLKKDTTYYVQVDGWSSTVGSFCIGVYENFSLPEPGSCTSWTQTAVTGNTAPNKWFNIYTKPDAGDIGLPVAAVKSSVNLGTVTVQEIKNPLVPISPGGVKYMQRYYNFGSTQNAAAPKQIRLFYSNAEFDLFKNTTPPTLGAISEDLNISHYDGINENCALSDNGAITYTPITAVTATSIGASGYFYLEFTSPSFSEMAAILGTSILPVELTAFSGKMEAQENVLSWKAASERNIAFYTVQRSANGTDHWTDIGRQLPQPDLSYTLSDLAPLPISHYRLAIKDVDGSLEYSNMIRLVREVPDGIRSIAPNPAQNTIFVEYQTTVEQQTTFQIIGSDGRLVMSQPIELVKGVNIIPFNIESIPAGLYYCRTNNGKGQPFVKQ